MRQMFYDIEKYYNIVTGKSMQTMEITHIFLSKKPPKCLVFNIFSGFTILSYFIGFILSSYYFAV